MAEKVQFIPSRLKSSVEGGYVAGAIDIVDDTNGKSQETINAEVKEAIGTGGSVDSRIAAAINALDSTKSQNAGADGLALNIVEENGKIISISGSIAPNTYDTYGAASNEATRAQDAENALGGRITTLETVVGTGGSIDSRIAAAKAELKGNATSACDTLGEAEAKINVNTSAISAEAARAQAAEADRYTKSETYTKTEVNGLVDTPHQEYVTVDAYASLPASGSKDTIYRVSNYNGSTSQVDASVYSEYAWDGSQYVFLCVKSQIGEVFDISVYNNNAKYADLAAALNGGANIPQSLQKGGMSVKFVQTSDNKYVQFRCIADEFTTDVTKWAVVDSGIYIENSEFTEVHTDTGDKILYGVKPDGDFYFGAGIPSQIQEELYIKVDKEEGKSLIDADYASSQSAVDNLEHLQITIDSEDKIIAGRTPDGAAFENVGFTTPKMSIDGATIENIEDPEERTEILTDNERKVISYRRKDGVKVELAGIETNSLKLGDYGLNQLKENLGIPADEGSVLALYPDKTIKPILSQYHHYANGTWTNPDWQDPKNFVLLWMSDIHSVWRRLGRIMTFYNHYKEYFDDIICTGDQTDSFPLNYNWRENGAAPALVTIGNHEVFGPARVTENYTIKSYGVPGYGQKECYEKYYKPFLDDTQITIEENKCYYYKDYPEYKIRIIVTDDYHCNETIPCSVGSTTVYPDGTSVDTGQQLQWFEEVLNDTLNENNAAYGYSVICLNHERAEMDEIDCPFNSLYESRLPYLNSGFTSRVHTFIENGGKFITWIMGDSHMDGFGLVHDYPEQLEMIIDTSGHQDQNAGCYERIENTYSDELFNVVSVDTYRGYISLKRIGCSYDKFGRHIDCMTYDYINKRMIQTN